MKVIIFTLIILFTNSGYSFNPETGTFQFYGTSFSPYGCSLNTPHEAVKDAIERGSKFCTSKKAIQIGETEVLDSFRGSCWAGISIGFAVSVQLKCEAPIANVPTYKEPATCTWEDPSCPDGYKCKFQWSEGPFECVAK